MDNIRPVVQTKKSAGADLVATEGAFINPGDYYIFTTGYIYDLPCSSDIRSRSGLAFKHRIEAYFGLIDEDFNGKELKVLLENKGTEVFEVKFGDRIAQLVPRKGKAGDYFKVLNKERTGGFGSTGKE